VLAAIAIAADAYCPTTFFTSASGDAAISPAVDGVSVKVSQ
jgi:hypothetical protein